MGIVRLLLAFIVAGDHFTVHVLLKPGITRDGIQQWVYMNMGFAVTFFYVSSGFLIERPCVEGLSKLLRLHPN